MFRKAIILILLLAVAGIAFADDFDARKKHKIKYLGDLTIPADEIVEGDVIVMQGDLNVKGVIKGDAIISLGDVYVDSGGHIEGDIVAWNGKIYLREGALVDGETIEHRLLDLTFNEDNFKVGSFSYQKDDFGYPEEDEDWGDNDDRYRYKKSKIEYEPDIAPRLSYNKVDGFFLGLDIPKVVRSNMPGLELFGYGGYGFSNDRWQYYTELDKRFFARNILEFGIESHKITDTDDNWIIENWENSLAAFFLHEDFRDYYYRQGFGAHISQKLWNTILLKAQYLNDEYDADENNTNWALFANGKDFLPNFSFLGDNVNAQEGAMKSLIYEGTLQFFRGDLLFTGSIERAGYGLGGDFEFTRYIYEIKGRMRLSRYDGLAFRLKLGSAEDALPPQKTFALGGISTLRGFSHKEFTGSELALLNVEYHLFAPKHARHFWLLKHIQLGLFADIGSTDNLIFSEFDPDQYKSDVGFALMDRDGEIRIDFARRTDTSKDPWVVTFRITQPF